MEPVSSRLSSQNSTSGACAVPHDPSQYASIPFFFLHVISVLSMCPTHLIFLNVIILIIFNDEWK